MSPFPPFLFLFLLFLIPNSISIKWLYVIFIHSFNPSLILPKRALHHRANPAWNELAGGGGGNCPRTKEERKAHGLITYQAKICTRLPELFPHIISAASLAVEVCQWTFADRRWNCSSVLNAPNLSAELTGGEPKKTFLRGIIFVFKEQKNKVKVKGDWPSFSFNLATAFVYALSSAAVTHQVRALI
jgi:hypothetical protein